MQSNKTLIMKVYISKYALTGGVTEEEGEIWDGDPKRETIKRNGNHYNSLWHKGDWHKTREEAVAKAEKFRDKRISSLKKQIEKLEKLKF